MGKWHGRRLCVWTLSGKRVLTKQFRLISSKVTPVNIEVENKVVKIKVHQVVHDLDGNPLADEHIYHHFRLSGDKVAEFDIGEKIKT